jgi:hypothetical protein
MKKVLLVLGLALSTTVLSCKKETIVKDTTIPSNTYRVEILPHEMFNNVTPNYDIRIVEGEDSLIFEKLVNYDDSLIVFEWKRPSKKIVEVIFNGNSTTDVNIKLFKNGNLEDFEQGINYVVLSGVY